MGEPKEWAIQDADTGQWWNGATWGNSPGGAVWVSKDNATMFIGEYLRVLKTWRAVVVLVPPREMTDEEAGQWLRTQHKLVVGWSKNYGEFWVMRDDNCEEPVREHTIGQGGTIFDAIRAARRKLEATR